MPHFLLFDPYAGGHHAEHVRHILRGWQARYGKCDDHRVTVAVAPKLLADHPDLLELGNELSPRIRFTEIESVADLDGRLLAAGLWHRHAVTQAINRHRPTHVLLLYFDHAQLALGLGLRFSFPVSLSGILFRPSFHYGEFETDTPPLRERVTRLRKRLVLQGALQNPHLATVFTLDPSAVPAISSLSRGAKAVALPDPVDPTPSIPEASVEAVRAAYGVEEGRTLALLFGLLAERKGVFALIDALRLLPSSAAQRLTVLFAGAIRPEIHDRLRAAAEGIGPPTLLLHDTFVPDDEVQNLIGASDLILVPYQRHIGSSGVLIRAAAAGRPVLGQDYGVVGQQITQHRLGRTVDSTQPEALAAALVSFLEHPSEGFDAAMARDFAERNTVSAYQRVLFDHLKLHAPPSPTG